MEIQTFSRKVQAGDLPLDKLASSSQVPQKDKVAEVSRQFESLLLRQILSQATKTHFKSGAAESGGTTSAIYQDMVTEQLADRISQGGTFGFAKALQGQLAFPEAKARPGGKPL